MKYWKFTKVSLSICIPTYNRLERIERLVKTLLKSDPDFELLVHVDGSDDNSYHKLLEIEDSRLRVSFAPNKGRAESLRLLIDRATRGFIMLYDDDDWILPGALSTILKDCEKPLPAYVAGYVYHMESKQGERIGNAFPTQRSNFIALRADHGVWGDKKEVVRTSLLKAACQDVGGEFRRVPTSLYWSRIALHNDVICQNVIVGGKDYLEGGLSSRISQVKKDNALPMALLQATRIRAFFLGRYRNPRFLAKAIGGMLYYGTLAFFRRHRPS